MDDILDILFRLNEDGIVIIMIEHIMRALMRFSERIVVLDAGSMSGGEQRMLATTRALMSEPRILLVDQPSAALAENEMVKQYYLGA